MSTLSLIWVIVSMLVVLGITLPIVYHYTRSYLFLMVSSLFITEIGFIIVAINSDGLYFWFMVFPVIPLYHFCAVALLYKKPANNDTE